MQNLLKIGGENIKNIAHVAGRRDRCGTPVGQGFAHMPHNRIFRIFLQPLSGISAAEGIRLFQRSFIKKVAEIYVVRFVAAAFSTACQPFSSASFQSDFFW